MTQDVPDSCGKPQATRLQAFQGAITGLFGKRASGQEKAPKAKKAGPQATMEMQLMDFTGRHQRTDSTASTETNGTSSTEMSDI